MLKAFQRDISAFAPVRVAGPPPSAETKPRDNGAGARLFAGKQALARLLAVAGQEDIAGHSRDMSRPDWTSAAGRDGTAAYRAVPLSRCPVPAITDGGRHV